VSPPRSGLALLADRGVIAPLDRTLAEALARLVDERDPHVLLGVALASRAVSRGHVCVALGELAERPLIDDDGEAVDVVVPSLSVWIGALEQSPLVGDGDPPTPLVLRDGRLYLHRYFDYEERLAAALGARLQTSPQVDRPLLSEGLGRLFPGAPGDEQRRAAAVAVLRPFTVISGGPGTGKTTTVARILALLHEQALARRGVPLRMTLVAPTGKAAQRLGEAIAASVASLPVGEAVREAIPREATTIHRALGYQPRTPTRFRHGASRPLDTDLVLADEASMIDLALMTKLVEAVPSGARLILLGDKDQLTSVEAGAILGDVHGGAQGVTDDFASALSDVLGEQLVGADVPPIADSMVQLDKSYRYRGDSGIGALARAVNAGDVDRALRVLIGEESMPYGEVQLLPIAAADPLGGSLGSTVVEGFRAAVSPGDLERRIAALSAFRVLCAHRRGPLGVDGLNAARLRREGITAGDGEHYDGRPILVTKNDYQMNLFNGDVGLVVRESAGLVACFPGDDGIRRVPVGRLPPHDTVFAMTVHKSQGSEFDRVAIVLPERSSPVLTRELLYTAVTRARKSVDLFGARDVVAAAIRQRVERSSGLRQALWG
jgi:exodeoxyribonuclease V alpha subunit